MASIFLAEPIEMLVDAIFRSDHIQALAHISKLMSMEDLRERIYSAATSAEVCELFKSQEQSA